MPINTDKTKAMPISFSSADCHKSSISVDGNGIKYIPTFKRVDMWIYAMSWPNVGSTHRLLVWKVCLKTLPPYIPQTCWVSAADILKICNDPICDGVCLPSMAYFTNYSTVRHCWIYPTNAGRCVSSFLIFRATRYATRPVSLLCTSVVATSARTYFVTWWHRNRNCITSCLSLDHSPTPSGVRPSILPSELSMRTAEKVNSLWPATLAVAVALWSALDMSL